MSTQDTHKSDLSQLFMLSLLVGVGITALISISTLPILINVMPEVHGNIWLRFLSFMLVPGIVLCYYLLCTDRDAEEFIITNVATYTGLIYIQFLLYSFWLKRNGYLDKKPEQDT